MLADGAKRNVILLNAGLDTAQKLDNVKATNIFRLRFAVVNACNQVFTTS